MQREIFFVIILMIMARYDIFSQYSNFEFGFFIYVSHNHQNYEKKKNFTLHE